MSFEPEKLLARRLHALVPYHTERERYHGTAQPHYYDSSENPYADPARARYVDNTYSELYHKVAGLKGVQPDQLIVGAGSDAVIDFLIRAFCEQGESNILIHPPTFGMYKYYALLNNVGLKQVPLTDDCQLDVPAIQAAADANTRLLFLCSPNNPTANCMRTEDMEALLRWFPGIVVVDEAYIDFCPERSFVPRLAEFPNMVVLHTFSKSWGMAGLRLGFGIASARIISLLDKVRPPYNVSTLSVQALLEAIQRPEVMQQQVADMLAERRRLEAALAQHPLISRTWHSDTNYVMVESPQAERIFRILFEKGLITRYFEQSPGMENRFRISVGTAAENDLLIAALAAITPQ